MSNYALVYYYFGGSFNKDYNPIPSICTVRKYNPDVPITILCTSENKQYVERYAQRLKYELSIFETRTTDVIHQIAYRPTDLYKYMMSTEYDNIIYSDADVMWHENPDEFNNYCLRSGQSCWVSTNLNCGMMGLCRNIDPDFMFSWHAVAHLMKLYANSETVRLLNEKHYSSNNVHDESALCVLKDVIKGRVPEIFWYPCTLSYIPNFKDRGIVAEQNGRLVHLPDKTPVYSVHYVLCYIRYLTEHKYNISIVDKIGRVGALLSIAEYRKCVCEQVGEDFLNDIDTIPPIQKVIDFIQ